MKRLKKFLFGIMIVSAFMVTSAAASEVVGDVKDSAARIDIEETKKNVFNNMLNSIDHYDAVEGEFTTTLISDEENTVVTYATNIVEQEAYQKISEGTKITEIFAKDGVIRTYDNKAKTYKVENVDNQYELAERVKANYDICSAPIVSEEKNARAGEPVFSDRIGEKDGVPVYRYRTDLTNTSHASASIFPQELTFGLLANPETWEIAGETEYVGREALVIEGYVEDALYAEKINVEEFRLTVDKETGIILEFIGFDANGNETESIKTNELLVVIDSDEKEIVTVAPAEEEQYAEFAQIVPKAREKEENSQFVESAVTNSTRASTAVTTCFIDNDTSDRDNYYNERGGFTAYLNDSNYYNGDMRRALSSSTDSYTWFMYDAPSVSSTKTVRVDLDVYLYSSTSNDTAAQLAAETSAYESQLIANMNQKLAPNGWSSYARQFKFINNANFLGIAIYASGTGSGYTGADAVEFTLTT